MAELDLTQGRLDALMTDPVTGRYNDIFDALLEREDQVSGSRTRGQMIADQFNITDEEGNAAPTYRERMIEEDPRMQELRRMRSDFKEEQDKGSGLMSGLRSLFDFAGIPTAETDVDISMRGIPAYSLMEGLTGGDSSEFLKSMGEVDPIDFERLLEEEAGVSPELSGLGALAIGMTKGRGKGLFDMLSESLNPNKTVGKNEFSKLDQMLEEGLKPKNVNKPPSTYNPPSKRFAALSDEGKKKIQGLLNDRNKLSGELNKDSVGGNKAMSMQRQLEVLEAQLRPFFPIDKMANGGRPGTVRRRKVTSPAGYKAGGQVYQKGYYGKSYK